MTEICDPYAGWYGIHHKWAHCRGGEEACLTIELLSVTSAYAYVGVDRSWADKEGRAINKGEYIEYLEGSTVWRVYCDGVNTSQNLANIRICYEGEASDPIPSIEISVDKTEVISGEVISIDGTWDHDGSSRGPLSIYQSIPTWYSIYQDDDPADIGTLETIGWTAPEVTTRTSGYFYAVLRDADDGVIATDMVYFWVDPIPKDAKGEIVSIDVPASAEEGASIDLCATITNTGEETGAFFLRFYDGTTMVRETLLGLVDPGETIEDICELFTMPDQAWSGKIELMREE